MVIADPTQELWLELRVVCDAAAVSDITELFTRYGFKRHIVSDEPLEPGSNGRDFAVAPHQLVSVRSLLSTGDVPPEDLEDIRNVLWVVRQSLWVMGRSRAVGPLEIYERQEEDWENSWKDNFSLLRVSEHILTKAPWHDYQPQPGEMVIEVDPGTAFGTGRHATTKLCAQALEEELDPGDTVLDVGTGSGTLAIAAALLGAGTVDAVDIDPVAIRVARETAERNGVGDKVHVALGSAGSDQPFQGPYDLVIANIIARVLIELAPPLTRAVKPGGALILGGILDDTEDDVRKAFLAQNLTFVRRTAIEDWASFVFRKPESDVSAPGES
jgi:ribosomal protein L11 methyltransferase